MNLGSNFTKFKAPYYNRMKILVTSIGTRGDMEPFLAMGEILKAKGHEVTCSFPEQFRGLVEDSNFQFETLGSEFIDMLESDIGKTALGGGGSFLQKIPAYIKLAKIQAKNNKLLLQRQQETVAKIQPDKIIYHAKVMYPVAWEVLHPNTTVMISPVPYLHYVKGHSHLAFNTNLGAILNKLTFKIADFGLLKTILGSIKTLRLNVSKPQIKQVLKKRKVIYSIAPELFKRPKEWGKNLQILGYHERTKTNNWTPSEQLESFLAKHPKPILVTFGSMTNPTPEEKTQVILSILEKHKIPAIINTCTGGLKEPEEYDHQLFHFVSRIPYDWAFPRVYAVMHHGGSGTTHMALKNGCPSLIIPHIIDQFLWNKMNAQQNLGPKGIRIDKLKKATLEPLLLDLYNNSRYKKNVQNLASEMNSKDYTEDIYNAMIQ